MRNTSLVPLFAAAPLRGDGFHRDGGGATCVRDTKEILSMLQVTSNQLQWQLMSPFMFQVPLSPR